MKTISISSINILAHAEVLTADHQSARSSYCKKPVQGPLQLGMTGFKGDSVTDKKHHGGNDKAICCYHSGHFAFWKQELDFDLGPAAFGENLTLTGPEGLETGVFVGDRYQLGEAVVEVSEPRGPCYMIGIRYNYKKFPLHLQETGFTGFYLRTIKTGTVSPDDQLVHIYSHPEKISIMDINRIRYHDPGNIAWLERLAALMELTDEWRERFERMLIKAKS